MSLIHPHSTDEYILQALEGGSASTIELFATLRRNKPITKQGFYAALRRLKAEEAVTVYKKVAALNAAWVRDMEAASRKMQAAYLSAGTPSEELALSEGESVSYNFASTPHLDIFWGHSQSLLLARTSMNQPIYAYDPHYWFYLARAETEGKLIADIVRSGRQFLMTAGGTTKLDRAVAEGFSGDTLQYHMQELWPERNHYLVVIGEYLTEVWLDPAVARVVDEIYTNTVLSSETAQESLAGALRMKAHHRIKITRNAKRARALQIRLGKPFFVKTAVAP